jgi:hypothetical protein
LAAVERETGGRSLEANLGLLEENAALAAEIANELGSRVEGPGSSPALGLGASVGFRAHP